MKDKLVRKAKDAMKLAYANYSNFKVGAALLTNNGTIYTGCNIENASYSLTCCAERVAIFKAISEGESEFKAMAIIAHTEEVICPCGACRQVMAEFFKEEMPIYLLNQDCQLKQTTISELLPYSFKL